MLSERVKEWEEQWKQKGLQQGLEQGLEQGMKEGRQEGHQEGRQEGLREGEATLLLRQLERKFGREVAEQYRATIEAADSDALLAWSEQILTASDPATIFGDRSGAKPGGE